MNIKYIERKGKMDKTKQNFDINTIKRLFGYISKGNKKKLALVIITIIINTISVMAGQRPRNTFLI